MKTKWLSALLVAAALAAAFIGSVTGAAHRAKEPVPASRKLVITGSSTMAPMLEEFARRFSTLHPGVRIEVQAGGSGRGITDVTAGTADIGMVSRALTGKEGELYGFAIGRDGVSLLVHASNPLRSLSTRQIAEIYSGRIVTWRAVGGHDAPISVVSPQPGYASVDLFTHFFDLQPETIQAQVLADHNSARVQAIVGNRHAIAYVSVGSAQRLIDAGAPVKLLPVAGVAATQRNIRNGNFPISRPLLLVTKDLPAGLAKEFIRFSLSAQVTDIVTAHDFVPYLD